MVCLTSSETVRLIPDGEGEVGIFFCVICTACAISQWDFLMFLSMNDFLPRCLFAVVIKCFMIGVNV